MGFFGNFFLWTCFHSFFYQQKKRFFFLLDSNWRNFGSFLFVQWLAEMFEPTFGLGGAIFLSLMGPLEIFQKKKKCIKLAPIAFFDQSGSKKSLVQSVEAARLFEVRVLQTGSLSNPTLTWGLIYPLRFHKTELEDLCALFKKNLS